MTDLQPGRELDARIATEVMGWTIDENGYYRSPHRPEVWTKSYELPQYSTDIAAAWGVVEKLDTGDEDAYLLTLTNNDLRGRNAKFDRWRDGEEATGKTAPLAVCLAALNALAAEEVKP